MDLYCIVLRICFFYNYRYKEVMFMFQNPYFQATQQLQPQQVTQVNGKASVEQLKLAPNSSLLAMDTTAPIVWLCKTDAIGALQVQAYDISPHEEKPPVDIDALDTRLSNIEKALAEMERRYDKPYVAVSKPKGEQPRRND